MQFGSWSLPSKQILISIILCIPGLCLPLYTITQIKPKTEGIVKVSFSLSDIKARFDISDVKEKGADVATRAQGMATQVVSEVSSKYTEAVNFMSGLPEEVTLGSYQVCWRYENEDKCSSISSRFENWFPESIIDLLTKATDSPQIPESWARINVHTCIIFSIVGIFFYITVLLLVLFHVRMPTTAGLCRLLMEASLCLLIFIPLTLAIIFVKFITSGLKQISFFGVVDGNLSQLLLISMVFTALSMFMYAWHRIIVW